MHCLPILKMQMCMPLALTKAKKPVSPIRLPQGGQVTINGTTNNLGTAEVYATATTSQGGEVPYQISMVRDGLGLEGFQRVTFLHQPVLTLFDPGFAPFHIVSKNETFI